MIDLINGKMAAQALEDKKFAFMQLDGPKSP
jgi:hypothetical protein